MKRFRSDKERLFWLAYREKTREKILTMLGHHVHVGSTQRLGKRVVYHGSCTCGAKVEFTLSEATAKKVGGIDLLIEALQQHQADMIFELVDELRAPQPSAPKGKICEAIKSAPQSSAPKVQSAIQSLKDAIKALQALDPQPESAPGPLQTESGRAYQAMTLAQSALSWLEGAPKERP